MEVILILVLKGAIVEENKTFGNNLGSVVRLSVNRSHALWTVSSISEDEVPRFW